MPFLLLTHDPQQSPGIARAGRVLRERKNDGAPFDLAWDEATAAADPADLHALRWARDLLRDAYENRGESPIHSVLVEA